MRTGLREHGASHASLPLHEAGDAVASEKIGERNAFPVAVWEEENAVARRVRVHAELGRLRCRSASRAGLGIAWFEYSLH